MKKYHLLVPLMKEIDNLFLLTE